ncbi:hypothetical protein WOLCODRAFT_137201 [Wolfiporia cocos MD-104 SS10]|uniref:Uncharacterized protein n=1 Tax=Wolfiporia cocos (strain MD-104) TaxID=742152 RepID=A0A2H3JWM6_WOLCO|nr:hypothetical protein WOLCODRAFT_137201 [Wolfiporia cocos MD-104 SS10]
MLSDSRGSAIDTSDFCARHSPASSLRTRPPLLETRSARDRHAGGNAQLGAQINVPLSRAWSVVDPKSQELHHTLAMRPLLPQA